MSDNMRLEGGLIDRQSPLSFTFNGENYSGFEGDTLASALIANGVKLVGRSFKYHRPRGIFSAGSEEPNALVQLRSGAFQEPNTRATTTELFDGLEATSQNHRGSLKYDLLAFNDFLAPFLSAGFYYKTFMWPKSFWEKVYEPAIRSAAGLGSLSGEIDPDIYDKGFLHCDLLIIGAGPAGLMSALLAGRSGAKVIIADDDFTPGGRLNSETFEIDDQSGSEWAAQTVLELRSLPNVRLMTRTTIFGSFDHGIYGALERKTDHLKNAGDKPRQVLWRIYSKRSILAAGAIERSIAFGNNDRPGVMLAGAIRTYANRFAATPGRDLVVFTNNNDGWKTAHDLTAKGVNVSAIIDVRKEVKCNAPTGTRVVLDAGVKEVIGWGKVKAVQLTNNDVIPCDGLSVSGGWSPNVHLTCHQRGRPKWREDVAGFVPDIGTPKDMRVIGAANGTMTLNQIVKESIRTTQKALQELDLSESTVESPKTSDEDFDINPCFYISSSKKRAWVDLQNDVTTKDVKQSHQEGFRSVEHLKRYTTLGMATDQGKTSNILGLAVMAETSGKTIEETGTTIFRPPYTPVPLGAFAGRARGKDFRPTRLTPSHKWASENGATFVEVGMWMRAQWYAKPGETHWRESVDREVLATRKSVGICDVTTLGKIDIQGKDATDFINRVYSNGFAKLAVGKVRYGLMLREDGHVMDDGTTARLSETHYVMTTTTANAVGVYRHLEFCRQCLWPDMDVHLISTTEQWAQFAVAGPNARKLLQKVIDPTHDISNETFPFMACGEIELKGNIPARLFRISFSGELAYEIAVPRRYGDNLMATLIKEGEEFDAVPYGTEALGVMRIEKGHVTGNELTGTTTAANIELPKMAAVNKDYIGAVLKNRQGLTEDPLRLVGFKPVAPDRSLKAGAHFLTSGKEPTMANDEGWMTSVAYSPHIGSSIGLGFLKDGTNRIGETVTAFDPVQDNTQEVEVVSAHFIDPEGERLRG